MYVVCPVEEANRLVAPNADKCCNKQTAGEECANLTRISSMGRKSMFAFRRLMLDLSRYIISRITFVVQYVLKRRLDGLMITNYEVGCDPIDVLHQLISTSNRLCSSASIAAQSLQTNPDYSIS